MRSQASAGAAASFSSKPEGGPPSSRHLRGFWRSKASDPGRTKKDLIPAARRETASASLQPAALGMAPCIPRPMPLSRGALSTSVSASSLSSLTASQWGSRCLPSSPWATTFRVAAGLLRRGGGLGAATLEGRRGALDLLKLATPVWSSEGMSSAAPERRRMRGPAGAVRALMDKSPGSSSPGSGGDKGKPPQKVGATAIPATTSGAAEQIAPVADLEQDGDGGARAALERLFAQAQLYERRTGDPDFATEEELEAVVKQLEADLGQVLGMLRSKEEELGRAEARLEDERGEVESARAVLVQREKQLEAVRVEQVGRQDELAAAKRALKEQRAETERVTGQLRARERDVAQQREDVRRKAREAQLANVKLLEQKSALAELEGLLARKQRDLGAALEERERQRLELAGLQAVLARQRDEQAGLKRELGAKRQRLESVESDLSLRGQAFAAARAEIQSLKTQLAELAGSGRGTDLELQHAQALLREVQDELRASNSAVLQFQAEVAEEEANSLRLEAEISRLGLLLQNRERELAASMSTRQKEAAELQQVQREFALAQQRVLELERAAEGRRAELEGERERVALLTEELSGLKKEARQQSAALSDVQLSLQVKQAELLTTRLEVQQLRSDLSAAQLTVRGKTEELEESQRAVASLRTELAVVRRQLAEKEAQLVSLGAAVAEKDKAISLLRQDADSSRLKLGEAELALEQIAQLSRMLADTARQDDSAAAAVDGHLVESLSRAALVAAAPQSAKEMQQALLSRANEDLFAANRALLDLDLEHLRLQDKVEDGIAERCELRAELEAVQECLRAKEAELEVTRGQLSSKEGQLQGLVRQWETREQEMGRMREEVLEGAREIEDLRDRARASGLVRGAWGTGEEVEGRALGDAESLAEEAAITKLELEVAKLEADSAIAALKALSDLSSELKEGCFETETMTARSTPALVVENFVSGSTKASAKGTALALAKMEEQLRERDAALSMAKQAMENLTDLTRRLVVEASAAMNASVVEGFSAC